MEAHGLDGYIVVNDSHIVIEWKTLRGRLSSVHGAPVEVIPMSRVFDVLVVPSTENRKGCLQIQMLGHPINFAQEHSWLSDVRDGRLNYVVMFNHSAKFEFHSVESFIKHRIRSLRTQDLGFREIDGIASGA